MGPGELLPGDHSCASFGCPRCGCWRLNTRPLAKPEQRYECDRCCHLFGAPQPPTPKSPDPAIPASKLREVVAVLNDAERDAAPWDESAALAYAFARDMIEDLLPKSE